MIRRTQALEQLRQTERQAQQQLQDQEQALLNARQQSTRVHDHLQALADAEPKPIRLRVPAGMAPAQMMRAGVEIIPDEEICEGFQMEADRVLYDYCIKAKELR